MTSRMWASVMMILVFLLMFRHAQTCMCIGVHLQKDFCSADVVIKVKFLSLETPEDDPRGIKSKYGMEVLEVFKGGPDLKSVKFAVPHRGCPWHVDKDAVNTEYLITGSLTNGEVEIALCNSKLPWNQVSVEQLKGILGEYAKGCSCRIIDRPGLFSGNWCIYDIPEWIDNQRCVPGTDDICNWEKIPV